MKPSARGELEITSLLDAYLQKGKPKAYLFDRGTTWLDTGTFDSMNDAVEYVRVIEERTGIKIGYIEEAAFKQGNIKKEQLQEIATSLKKVSTGCI